MTKPKAKKRVAHKHYFSVEHAVYSDTKNRTLVHRWCEECGKHWWGYVKVWRRMPERDLQERLAHP
jgi:ribosomal protein L32